MNYSSKLCKEVKTPSKDTSNLPICATLQEYKKKMDQEQSVFPMSPHSKELLA